MIRIKQIFSKCSVIFKRTYIKIRFGKITEHIICTAGDNAPAEIEYKDRSGKVIGYWAYGY